MGNTIDQISELLDKANLPWLLTNLRQNVVIWEQWNDPAFLEKFIQSKPLGDEFNQADFSPSRLALLALDQYNALDKHPGDLFDIIDDHTLQSAIRNFNDQSLISTTPQNFESVSLLAIAMAYKYHITRSWFGLIDAIREHPTPLWHPPMVCLYGLVDDSTGLLQALVQPGASMLRVKLAVHILLANPLSQTEQVEKLVYLVQSPNGDRLPARERLMLLHALQEQNREITPAFSREWLSLNQDIKLSNPTISLVDNISQLMENLFLTEIYQAMGDTSLITDLINNEKDLSEHVAAGALIHYTTMKNLQQPDVSFGEELSAIREQIFPDADLVTGVDSLTPYRGALALTLANQGKLDEAVRLLDTGASLPDEVNTLFAIAKTTLIDGNHEGAVSSTTRLLELLDQHPGTIPVWGQQLSLVNLGKLLLELRLPDKSSRIFEQALEISPSDTTILKLFADSLLASHRLSKACEALHTLVSIQPKNIDYRRQYAQALEDMADWDAGLYQRSKILDIYQDESKTIPTEDYYAYASTSLQASQPELTIQVCEKLLTSDPEDAQALIYSGKAYLRIGKPDMGMECLVRATQASPQIAETWLALAEAQRMHSTTKLVIDTLTSAATAVPNSAEIHFALGETYLQDNAPTLALPELNAAVELSPEDPKILFDYAKALQQLGHQEESLKVLSRAYSLDPYLPGLAQAYARMLFQAGKLEEAIIPFELLIDQKMVHDAEPYLEYARCILMYNKTARVKIPPMKALVALNEVLQIDPEIAEARALIAETLAANGDLEMAFQAYREALDTTLIDDKEWLERLSYGFGSVASSIGKYDIAIAALQEAGQANPDNPAIYKALSDAYLAANLLEDAIRSARYVLVLEGEDADNLSWFAGQAAKLIIKRYSDASTSPSLLSKTVPEEALNALAKAIQLSPTRTDLIVQFGNLQALIGAQEESRMTFLSLASLDFAAIEDLKAAADYLSSIGDHAGAISCLERGIACDHVSSEEHDVSLYIKLAGEHVKNNDSTSAINSLDRAIDTIPYDSTLLSLKVELLLGLGQSVEALECIETAIQGNTANNPTELNFLAAWINRCNGDMPEAYKYSQEGISALASSNEKDDFSALSIHNRTLLAEIYRALLQPDLAFRVIGGQPNVSASNFENEQDYLDFICLHTEIALEAGEQIKPDIQDIQPDPSHPAFSRVMAITSRLMNKAGNFKQAEQIYQVAVKNFANRDISYSQPNWTVPYYRYLTLNSLVEAALDLGIWDHLQSDIKSIMETDPDEPLTYLHLARELVLRREYYNLCESVQVTSHKPGTEIISKQAIENYKEYLNHARSLIEQYQSDQQIHDYQLNLDSINHWQARAEVAFNLNQEDSPDQLEHLAHARTAGDTAVLIAHLHHTDTQRPESDSISRMIKYARAYSRNPSVMLQVALALRDSNPAEAMKSLQTMLQQNPYAKNHVIACCQYLLAEIASGLGEYDTAQDAIEKALEYWQDEPAWHALAALIYKNSPDTNSVVAHLAEAARLDPTQVHYHLELGKIYYQTAYDDARIIKLAQKSIDKALELDVDNLEALVLSANIYCVLNDYENAEMNARSALAMAPNRADIHQLLSEISIRSSDFQGAYEYANKALQLNPKDVQSTITLARSLSALGRHSEALAKLNSVLPIAEDSKSVYLERVKIVREVNGARAGIEELKSLSETYPEDFNIMNELARTYLEVGELEEAINHAQMALSACSEKTPRNEQANLHLMIGQVLHQIGQLDQSIQHLQEAIQLAPDRLEPYLELGLARKERREYQQALLIFEQATSIDPEDPRAPFQAGLALKESKDYKSSEMMLRRAVSLAPHDLNIRRQLAAVVALNLVHNPRTGRN